MIPLLSGTNVRSAESFRAQIYGVNLPSMLVCLGWRSWKMTISPDDGIIPVRAVMFTW